MRLLWWTSIAALKQLVAAHRQDVYRYGLRACRSPKGAEDAGQESLWAVTRALHTFRGTASSIASWLFTTVRRECLRLLEGHRRTPGSLDCSTVMADVVDPADSIAVRQRVELLAAALADLDPLHREAILLRDIQELMAPEAAARLGVSTEALKRRLHRARNNLRDHVRRRSEVA